MEALLPILTAIFPSVEFEGLSIAEWGDIVAALAAAQPEIEAMAEKLTPIVAKVVGRLKLKDSGTPLINTIPGYAADGSVTPVPSEISGVR